MAFYIAIRKQNESETIAEYTFGRAEDATGRLRIDKATGEIELVVPLPGDDDERLFARAARKIWQHWSKGELPESTSWAS